MGEKTERIIARHDAHTMRNFRRNYAAHAIEGGLYMAGLTFIAYETVLPPIIKSLGGPAWLIALAPSLATIGFAIPPLFTAHILEPLTRKMPIVVWSGVFVRGPFLVAALCLLLLADSHPLLTLTAVAVAPFLNGLINGLVCPAWFELFAKTVPPGKRASLFAVRLILAGIGGLIAGKMISYVLAAHPGPTGYGILHLICFLCLMGSLFVFMTIKETPLQPLHRKPPQNLRESLAEVPAILKEDLNFRSFVISRIFGCAPYAAFPFLSIHALETLKLPQSYLGGFFMAFTVGSMAGNFFAGYMGDRFGGRRPLVAATALYMMAFGVAAFASSLWVFLGVFMLTGFCRDATNVSASTLMAELPPQKRRLKYLAIGIAIMAPGMILAPLLGSVAWTLGAGRYVFPAAISLALLAISLYLAWRLRDPRNYKGAKTWA